MNLALPFLVVIVVVLTLLAMAMYMGGGASAVRSQLGLLALLAGALVVVGLAIILIAQRGPSLSVLAICVSAGSAVVAGWQARSIEADPSTPRARVGAALWLVAGFLAILTIVGAAALLA